MTPDDDEISLLTQVSLNELRRRWTALKGAPAPMVFRRPRLARALAYEIQAARHGDHDRQALAAWNGKKSGASARRRLKPGVKLIRGWKGVVHEVQVLPDGYQWNGQTWPSLSRIAGEITGTKWNGLVFFGLSGRGAKAAA
jgi:hypothetical protein